MQVDFIQGIISYPSAGSTQQFLTYSGSTVRLEASAGPTTVTVANGQANYLITEAATVLSAWTGIPPSDRVWLYWDIDRTTAIRTFGFTTLLPIHGATPSSSAVGQHWFDTVNKKMFVRVGSSWVEKIRVFAAAIQAGTFYPMGVVGLKPYAGSQVGLNTPYGTTPGNIIVTDAGTPIIKTDGTFFTTATRFFTNGAPATTVKLEADIFTGTADTNIPAYQVVKFSSFGHVDLATYNDEQTNIIAMAMEDIPTGQPGTLCMQGVITNSNWNWPTVGVPLWVSGSVLGGLTATDPFISDPLTHTVSKPPVARVISPTSVFFDQGLGGKGDRGDSGNAAVVSAATTTTLGTVTLSANPADPTNPIAVETTDSRMNDARHPLAHTQDATTVTVVPSGTITHTNAQLALQDLDSAKLNLTGGTLTGSLILAANPTANLEAATKQYVDNSPKSLAGLTDVLLTTPTNSQSLVYNGTTWVNGDRVSTVSVTTAHGVSGSVANASTTPAITLTLGDITPSSISVPAGDITALTFHGALTGNVTGNVSGYSSSFSGTLVGDVTGTQGATVVSAVGTSSAADVHAATLLANNATNINTANTLVKRDAFGNFVAGTITANLTGNVSGNVSGSAASFTGSLVGDVTGTQGSTTVAKVGTSTAANVHAAELLANAATNSNTASTIVKRDAFGNFSAGTITADLTGNVSGSATSFSGNLAGDVSGPQGSTLLATVNPSSIGSYGSASRSPSFTVNGKGLITAASDTAISITPTQAGLSNVANSLQVINAGGALSIQEDISGNRPTAGTPGRIFIDTTVNSIYRDNGATWDQLGGIGGTLSIASGGTNSGTALNNNRVMKSAGGAIVEAAAINANVVLVSDANGIPVHSTVSTTTLGYLDATSSVQNQLNAKAADSAVIKKDGSVAFTANQSMGTFKITSLGAPGADADAATKKYVDDKIIAASGYTPIFSPAGIADSNVINDSLSTPPITPLTHTTYLVGPTATGDWTGLEGHLMQWNGAVWVDVLGRAVIITDNIGVSFDFGTAAGGLVGQHNKIATLTDATPGSYAYTFYSPVNNDVVMVTGVSSLDASSTYAFNVSVPVWVKISTPSNITPGDALEVVFNTMNVRTDNSSVGINLSNQLQVLGVGGSTAANVHAAELLANAATNASTPSTIVLRDASGNFSAGTITANITGNVSGSAASFTGSLIGDVTGTQGATVVSTVGTSSAANVHAAELLANAATNANTISTIVKRDASGNFSAGTITAALTGNVTGNVSGSAGSFTGSLIGDVTGTQGATVVSYVGTSSAANVHAAELLANAATNANTVSAIVRRDASGNFSAGTVTASLTGNVTGNVSGSSSSFTGSLGGDVSGSQGSTVLATVNTNVGSWGSASSVPTYTVNGKGLITAASNTAISITPTAAGLGNVANSLQVINAGGAVSIQEDITTNRPAAGTAGRLFIDTTSNIIYRDTGSLWQTIGGGGGGGGGVSSIDASGGTTGMNFSGGPITASGTLTMGGTLLPTNGGTGLSVVGTAGTVLTSNGTSLSFQPPSGGSTIGTTLTSTNAPFYPLFVAAASSSTQAVDVGSGITFNPSTNVLTTTEVVATTVAVNGVSISSAGAPTIGQVLTADTTSSATWVTPAPSGIAVTDDTVTNAVFYPIYADVITGTLMTGYTSSTKYYYNPSSGTLSATNFTSLSDENYKTNVCDLVAPMDVVNQLRGVSFNWIDTGAKSYGVIAQEVEKVLPAVVNTNDKGQKTVDYQAMIAFLIETIKDLDARVKYLESK